MAMHIGNIFADLEIDTAGMMDDKVSIKRFAKDVLAAESNLVTVLATTGPTVSSIEELAINTFRDDPRVKESVKTTIIGEGGKSFAQTINDIYATAENVDLAVAHGMMVAIKKLAADMELQIHDRAKLESTSQQDSINDKKLAQIQHKRLREAWETYCKFVKLFHSIELPKIKSRPGNYAPSLTDVYQYQFPGEDDVMYNHRVVAQRLGIWYDGMKFMDIFEYCENHPELVTIKKVQM